MNIAQAVSKRIDELLFKNNMSLYKLGKLSGIPMSTLKNFYNGHTKSPSLAVIYSRTKKKRKRCLTQVGMREQATRKKCTLFLSKISLISISCMNGKISFIVFIINSYLLGRIN